MNTLENTETLQNQLQVLNLKKQTLSRSSTVFSSFILALIILAIIFKEQFEMFALLGGISALILLSLTVFGFIYFFISRAAVTAEIRLIENKLAVVDSTKFHKKSMWPIVITVLVVLLLIVALILNHMYVRKLDGFM